MRKISVLGVFVGLFAIFQAALAGAADNLTVYGYRGDFSEGRWAVVLRFNHPVFPSNVAGATTVTSEKAQEKFDLLDPESKQPATSPTRSLLLVPQQSPERVTEVTIAIERGLSDSTGRRLLEKSFSYKFLSVMTIGINSLTSFYKSGSEKGVYFYTSEFVPEEELSRAVNITPRVPNIRISRRGGSGFQITGDFEFNRDYTLKVSPVSVNKGKGVLEAKSFDFKGPGIAPDISIKTDRSIVELRGRQLLSLWLGNVDKIRCGLTRVPAYLVPEASEAYTGDKKTKEFNVQTKAEELKKFVVRINPAFLAEPVQDSEAFFAKEGKGNAYGFSVPLSFRKNPEQGGAWLAVFTDPDGNFKGSASRLIQITDLSVSYKFSGRNLLLWVTSLYTGLPAAGVEVMLSHADGHKYFVGKTEENGCLMITDGQIFPAADSVGQSAKRPLDLAGIKWVVAATS
ncbi:MAG: hypothetical protein HY912_03250, partial [Desulfomonile tiedjei]|nr:hypothetical protein [Desulfomonile tiedjei]